MATEGAMLRIAIYGSCVSRDTFDFFRGGFASLQSYVSRQSLISAMHPADSKWVEPSEISSPFQLRNAVGDFVGDAGYRIGRPGANLDTLLVDLIDERNGVLKLRSGGFVTYSYDLFRAGIIDRLYAAEEVEERVCFGTDKHFEVWKQSATTFFDELCGSSRGGRIVSIESPWALATEAGGRPNVWSHGPEPEVANVQYERYYSHLRDIASLSVALPESLAVTKTDHKWGPAAYHYIDAAYEHLVSRIEAIH